MSVLAGDPANWNLCPSFFPCGTLMANNAGSEALTGRRDFDKARNLIAEAGYKGERIVVLDAVDTPTAHAHGLVVFELLKKLGAQRRTRDQRLGQPSHQTGIEEARRRRRLEHLRHRLDRCREAR